MALFKAYDVRGIYPDDINAEVAYQIGHAFGQHLAEDKPNPHVVVAVDARPSGPILASAMMQGLTEAGATSEFIGIATSPMLYWAVAGREDKADGGAMITASHNPARYNGIKFCRADAVPIALDTGLADIRDLAAKVEVPEEIELDANVNFASLGHPEIPTPAGISPVHFAGYMGHVTPFARKIPEGLKVALDTANGVGAIYTPLLRHLGLNIVPLFGQIDGTFPNHEANPSKLSNLAALRETVTRENCNLGIAFDGDADRAVFVDENANAIGPDIITALLAQELLKRNKGAVIYDLRSSKSVRAAIEEEGGRAIRERVGHSFIKATMRKIGAIFGGELAGHYYFRDSYYADSAIIAVLETLNAMGRSGQTLSQLVSHYKKYAQSGEINFRVDNTDATFDKIRSTFSEFEQDDLDGVTVTADDWWFNLRASNTEPVVRLNLEAKDAETLAEKLKETAALIGSPLD